MVRTSPESLTDERDINIVSKDACAPFPLPFQRSANVDELASNEIGSFATGVLTRRTTEGIHLNSEKKIFKHIRHIACGRIIRK